MKNWKKLIVVAVIGTLMSSAFTAPSSNATANSITVAETQAGGTNLQYIATPWVNSGGLWQTTMFRALLITSPDGRTIKGDLASSYKVSKDGKTVTFTMKPGLKWSDGTALGADDVVWSINELLRVAQANANYVNAFKQIVGSSEVNAKSTASLSGVTSSGNNVTIQLVAPSLNFIPLMAQFMILPKHSLESQDPLTLATNAFWKAPVTSGPFKVGTLSPGNFFTLVPNTNYEGTKPSITEINVIKSADLVSDARAGKIDYFYSNSPAIGNAMKSVTNFKAIPVNAPFYRYFVFNLTGADAAFKNIKARQALEYGVDWNSLVPLVYPTVGKVINSGVAPGMPYHLSTIPRYKYDVTKAKQLLKEANFDFSKTVRLRHYYGTDTVAITFMTAIAQQLKSLGMKVEMTPFQGDATTELYTTKNYDIALKGLSAFSVSEWYAEYSNTATFQNIIGPQPDFAAANAALSQAVTLKEQGKALTDLQNLEQQTLLKMPLHLLRQTVYVSTRIYGVSTLGNPLDNWENNFANWKVGS